MHPPSDIFLKDQEFGLWPTESEVSTLTLADALVLTVWSTDAGTHKIDGLILKLFIMV